MLARGDLITGAAETLVPQLDRIYADAQLGKLRGWHEIPLDGLDPTIVGLYKSEQNQRNIAGQRAVAGADELIDVPVLVPLNGHQHTMVITAARYGDRWWVETLHGNLATLLGIPATGAWTD